MTQERTYLDTNIIFHRKLHEKDVIEIIKSVIGHTFKYCSAFVVSAHKKVFLLTKDGFLTSVRFIRISQRTILAKEMCDNFTVTRVTKVGTP